MKGLSRIIADVLIGLLTASSGFLVDVTIFHRAFIAVTVALAMETTFFWLDNRTTDRSLQKRKDANREKIMHIMTK